MGSHLSGVPSADTEGLRLLASLTSPAGMGPAYSLHCSVDGEQPVLRSCIGQERLSWFASPLCTDWKFLVNATVSNPVFAGREDAPARLVH
jgi:hypothetical protein